MIRLITAATAIFLSILIANVNAAENAKQIFKQYASHVVYIENKLGGMGTGFFLEQDIIVTNRHVVFGPGKNVKQWNAPKKIYLHNQIEISKYRAISCSVRVDLCFILIKSSYPNKLMLKIAEKKVMPGDDLFIIGHPSGVPMPVISTGIASSQLSNIPVLDVFGKPTGFKGFTTNAAISSGSSGSPVFSEGGLVGVAVSYMKNSQNLNFVISSDEITNFIKNIGAENQKEFFVFEEGFEKKFERMAAEQTLNASKQDNTKYNPSLKLEAQKTDPDIIRRKLLEHLFQFRYCYQKILETTPSFDSGILNLKFTIGPSGEVIANSTFEDSKLPLKLRQCVIGVLNAIVFPEPLGGGTVEVWQPFNFKTRPDY